MKFSPIPHTLNPIPKHMCLLPFLILSLAFLFSCAEVESPDLQQLEEEHPLGEVGGETWFWCVNLQENTCEAVSSLADCSGKGGFGAYSCPDNYEKEIPSSSSSSDDNGGSSSPVSPSTGPVAVYGKLKASGKNIVGSKTGTTAVQVRGVSLGWSNTGWESASFFNAAAVNAMVDGWKAEIIRVPMGHKSTTGGEYSGSYLDDKAGNMARVKAAIDAAINKGVYVIIDWHSHDAHLGSSDAAAFFEEMAKDYGSYDNVIFEIYNEPLNIPWSTIKSYATTIISKIRAHSSNLILVGTPNWDQDVNAPAGNWISDNNVAYVFHFYAASHSLSSFQSKINATLSAGYPVFVSEYGTVSADGNGSHDASASNTWITYLNNNKISYCAWHVNNKNEASAFFVPTFTPSANANWTSTSNMTASGQYIYNNLVAWANNAPWKTGNIDNTQGNGDEFVSETRCKDDDGNDYFCQWPNSCWAIDPTFSETTGATCESEINTCLSAGKLYVGSTVEGEYEYCDGTLANIYSNSKYCYYYSYNYYYCDRIGGSYVSSEFYCSYYYDGIILNNRDACFDYVSEYYIYDN